jgi:plasmid stabilization system protein ParE
VTPLRIHPEAAVERRRAIGRMRHPDAAVRFDGALGALFDRIEEAPEQFPEHCLLVLRGEWTLLFAVRRAVLDRPFPYVIFFYVRQGTAIVLAIAHARRRPGYWADRR